jgi:hypothetical protein
MSEKKSKTESTKNELTAAEEKKGEIVNFVANNMLNNITLNQVVTLVQQVVVRDANTLVTDADADKLAEIEKAFDEAKNAAAPDPGAGEKE